MRLVSGIVLVMVGLGGWLHHTHLRRLRAWSRGGTWGG